jgi:hypothetical protein
MAKVKGTNLIGAVKALRKSKAHGLKALPPALHHYLEERVIVTEWYPEADLILLMRAMAPLLADVKGDPFELLGRAAVRDHMGGVYQQLLKGDRMSLARRVGVMWQAQHDTGKLNLVGNRPGRARYELEGYATPSREMCSTLTGYISEALVQSGFAAVQIDKLHCVLNGHPKCVWDCRWRDEAKS